jgi:hypothetical protein
VDIRQLGDPGSLEGELGVELGDECHQLSVELGVFRPFGVDDGISDIF